MNMSEEVEKLLGRMEAKSQRTKESNEIHRTAQSEFPDRFLAIIDGMIAPCMEEAAVSLKKSGVDAKVDILRSVIGGGRGVPCITLQFAAKKMRRLDGTMAVRMIRYEADVKNLRIGVAKRTGLELARSESGYVDGSTDYSSIRYTDLNNLTRESVIKEILSAIREGVEIE